MVRTKNISIQKKILFSMLILTLLPIVLITAVAMTITYRTMCSQLVYDHRMSSGWLQRSMNVLTADTLDQFYEFEVNRDIKNDIMRWCIQGEALNYEAQWKIITAMNTVMNINSNVKRIELFNLVGDQVLTTERSGAQLSTTGNQLEVWNQRDPGLQTNLMYCKGEDELLVYHLIFNFDNKMPAALLAFHLKPHYIREILDEIKTVDAETLIVLNDENNVLEANYGSQWHIADDRVEEIRRELAESERKEVQSDGHFWFYRTVSGGKLQLLTAVPNQTIVNAMFPTMLGSLLAALGAVAASIVCSVVYSLAVSKPIRSLAAQMEKITLDLLIQEHNLHPDNPYMFPSPVTGTMYHPDAATRIHRKLLKEAGIEHIRFHDLRHTFATLALQNGVDVKTLSGMLGHYSSGFTLDTYTHITDRMQQEAAEKVGNFMEMTF